MQDKPLVAVQQYDKEKMLELRENLLRAEEDRQAGRTGCSVDALDAYLGDVLCSVENDA